MSKRSVLDKDCLDGTGGIVEVILSDPGFTWIGISRVRVLQET